MWVQTTTAALPATWVACSVTTCKPSRLHLQEHKTTVQMLARSVDVITAGKGIELLQYRVANSIRSSYVQCRVMRGMEAGLAEADEIVSEINF